MSATPRLILTSGEPAGVGPDLCLKIACRDWPCELVAAGDAALFRQRADLLGLRIALVDYEGAGAAGAARPAAPHKAGTLPVLHESLSRPAEPGKLDPGNARYVLRLLDRAVAGCRSGEFDAMVTAPVQKSVINDAGIAFTGHTEYLAQLTDTPLPVMMLATQGLRVALATIHVPLNRVGAALTLEGLVAVLRIIDADLKRRFGLGRPRIRVCGLNPHAGEDGHLGREEIDIVSPAIEQARREGIDASGPAPADTAFTRRSLTECDVVLAMYHDQGLPVIKYAGFGEVVNITLGLPIVRTSVDHGTALDLAGTGRADEGSLVAAIEQAMQLARA